ncbi:uncharacterized protein LOC115441066 [Manduca sexta]|uniref:Death domain-containing protein n=1 Tax=Manduca sexta TaxID=7130 RepID=A0A921YXL8_MANSE|nr:uncharacterized protein LOC115441066 [Manduca sexta]KAG6446476.1 hypothetical protein O3G_MSEX004460 [Manduca sexta]KAG6446477.1 hypothetical protein O3G_MSEX004460 [Manduca sexta]
MTLSESKFKQLKEQIILHASATERHAQILNSLKDLFKEDINSVRRFEQISNIAQLLKVLEIRDVLSEDDVAPLKDVARQLPNSSEMLRKIAEYEENHKCGEFISVPKSPPKQKEHSHSGWDINSIQNSEYSVKKERIFEVISEEIGTHWRNLARYLKTRECTIIEIDSKNIPLSSKAMEILKLHCKKANPQKWFFDLCNALDKVHRTDIVLSLQEIMSMNI